MLKISNIQCSYGHVKIIHGVSLNVEAGKILCLMGRNGAGKTTILKSIMGLVRCNSGSINLSGKELAHLPPHKIPGHGLGYIPQGRRLFSELTVSENLEVGLMTRNTGDATLQKTLDLFPRLRERLNQRADTLSGGEQQMLATARALCLEPQLLLLDEPTEGLQPSMIEQIRRVIIRMKEEGVAVILVEQRIDAALSVADHITFIENGLSKETVNARELNNDRTLLERYVGV